MPSRHRSHCEHGYIPSSCAECRAARPDRTAGVATRQAEIRDRIQEIVDDPYSTAETHGAETDSLVAEYSALRAGAVADIIAEGDRAGRRAELDLIRRAAQDPGALESGDGGGVPGAAPLIHGRGTRVETAAETISRANPWADPDTSAAGCIARAHTALETVAERLGHDGAELLAQAMTERLTLPGITVRRSRDEAADAAALILALSSPFYESAMRSVFRAPQLFAAGMGHMMWTDEERQAMHGVLTNTLARAAFAETSGAAGAYALPLQLDPSVVLTNSGVVGPFRQLARTVIGTSNVWEGVTSAGVTAHWYAEAAVVSDDTPTLGQIAITPYRESAWSFGSFEVLDDTQLADQLPAIFADAKTRLELTAFATGTGSGQPYGAVTRAASDATAGALTNAMVYALHGNVPPRFRVGGGARPAWMSNVSILNAARQLLKATGMTESIVDDSASPPRMVGIPYYEASAMVGGTTGNKELLLGDFSQMIIVDRLPSVILAEPMVKDATSQRPTGQRGWLHWSRVGSDITTAGAAYGANAFVVHTH